VRFFRKNLKTLRKEEYFVLLQVAWKEYEFSLMQDGGNARLKKENISSIVYNELFHFAR
jgi:hypothetical protein